MDIEDGIQLIQKCYLKYMEDKLYQLYLVDYGRMDQETFISWDDYKDKFLKSENETSTKIDTAEVLKQAEMIKNMHQKSLKIE